MARPTQILIDALRTAAARLEAGADYSWTHMGSCNCGHLAQSLTKMTNAEIHQYALQKAGDWGQQALDHCMVSGYPMDHIITTMIEAGMTHRDIHELERLSSHQVLSGLPGGPRSLDYRQRDDVVEYMRTWAEQLAEQLRRERTAEPSTVIQRIVREGLPRTDDRSQVEPHCAPSAVRSG